jgi:hypothetical protein
MMIETCPSDIVGAPADRVWELLIDPQRLIGWSGTTLIDGPRTRLLVVGDRLVLGVDLGLTAVLVVQVLAPPRAFTVDVRLPLGVVNHETVQIMPLDEGRCRVSFG